MCIVIFVVMGDYEIGGKDWLDDWVDNVLKFIREDLVNDSRSENVIVKTLYGPVTGPNSITNARTYVRTNKSRGRQFEAIFRGVPAVERTLLLFKEYSNVLNESANVLPNFETFNELLGADAKKNRFRVRRVSNLGELVYYLHFYLSKALPKEVSLFEKAVKAEDEKKIKQLLTVWFGFDKVKKYLGEFDTDWKFGLFQVGEIDFKPTNNLSRAPVKVAHHPSCLNDFHYSLWYFSMRIHQKCLNILEKYRESKEYKDLLEIADIIKASAVPKRDLLKT